MKCWKNPGSYVITSYSIHYTKLYEEQLLSFIKNSLAQELNKGITLTFDKKLQSGLKISPIDGSYIVSLTEEDFASFFKAFIRPKTNRLLFRITSYNVCYTKLLRFSFYVMNEGYVVNFI